MAPHWFQRWRRPSFAEARASRPDQLGSIEAALEASPPRKLCWLCANGTTSPWQEALCQYQAMRGWVVRVIRRPDPDGAIYHLWFAFEQGQRIETFYRCVSNDAYHWAVGHPASFEWFQGTMVVGHALTLLEDQRNPRRRLVFGLCEPYLRGEGQGLYWAAT